MQRRENMAMWQLKAKISAAVAASANGESGNIESGSE